MHTYRSTSGFRRLLAASAVGLALTVALVLAVRPPARAADGRLATTATATTDRLGTCYANYATAGQDLAPLAYEAGSRWDRVDFSWDRLEPEQGQWNFEAYDALVDSQRAYGLDIVAILGSTPGWAADPARCPASAQSVVSPQQLATHPAVLRRSATDAGGWQACPPSGLHLRWDDPGNAWGAFVFRTVSHYRDQVKVWEIWNEPDLWDLFWRGTVDDYAQLLRIGYQAVKAADPDATVLFAGLAYWADPSYYIRVLDVLTTLPDAAQHNHFFDVMSLHLYSNVYQIRPIAAEIQAAMSTRVGPRPIWLTETGVPLWDEWAAGYNPAMRINHATAEEAAAYMIQGFAEARSIGIDRFLVFRTHDEEMRIEGTPYSQYFGLIRNDLTLRPAYHAFRTAATYLHGENQVTGPIMSNGVRRITFWATPRGRVDVLWNTTGAPITFSHTAHLPEATLIATTGQTTTIVAAGGVYTITLPPATADTAADGSYLIGGLPVLVLHEDTQPPTMTLRPLPALTYSHSLTLSWDVLDQGAGYWYAEIARATAPTGTWQIVAGLNPTRGVTTTVVSIPIAGTHTFRARARDHAGNWSAWPSTYEISTTVILTRTVTLSVATYLDSDSSDTWDPGEVATTTSSLVWRDPAGEVVSRTTGSTWQITQTVDSGLHSLRADAPDHLPATYAFSVPPGPGPQSVGITLGLKPIRARAFLPLILRNP